MLIEIEVQPALISFKGIFELCKGCKALMKC